MTAVEKGPTGLATRWSYTPMRANGTNVQVRGRAGA
jgi:hypothetical protein